jgi:ribosomal protein L11 methyltransferase
MNSMTYAEVILRVSAGEEEAAESALLELGATGTSRDCGAPESSAAGDVFWPGARDASEPEAGGEPIPVEVVGYFASGSVPDRGRVLACFAGLRGALQPRAGAGGTATYAPGQARDAVPEVHVRLRPARDWAAETRRSFAPFQPLVGLTVAPPWDRPARVDGSLIVINPGAAFGLGTHATTRSCLGLIPPAPRGLAPALDVGTGTGILAIRAAQLGYAPVVGCDSDAVAAAAAHENLIHNDMGERVAVLAGTLSALRVEAHFALVLANIFLNPLLEMAEDLARRLESDGRLVASGLYAQDAPALIERFAGTGLRLESQRVEEQWAALRFTRSRPRPVESAGAKQP